VQERVKEALSSPTRRGNALHRIIELNF
jgi:hypothetical protein